MRMNERGVGAAGGLAIVAVLLFALAAALQYAYISPVVLNGFSPSDIAVLGVLALIAAIGFRLGEDKYGR
jgi:UDP-N-acetylmuramyl pentapeptide phosphotransferase/UDP-N-acetylglucosamine-1-phosphate transferase